MFFLYPVYYQLVTNSYFFKPGNQGQVNLVNTETINDFIFNGRKEFNFQQEYTC